MKRTGILKKGGQIKRKPKSSEKISEEKEQRDKIWELFDSIWNSRPHRSEVSGETIWGENRSIYYHHILPKSVYKQAMYDPDNIIVLSGNEHSSIENNPTIYPEVNRRRELLKIKYGV